MDDAAYAVNVVGGVLLGAALAALVLLFTPVGPLQPLASFGLAALCLVGVHLAELRRGPRVAEAGLAAALVAAASIPFYAESPPLLGALAAIVAVWVALVRGGTTLLTLLCVPAFFVGARHATGSSLARGHDLVVELAFVVALLGFGALLVRQRRDRWASVALPAQALALTLAMFPLLDAMGVVDAGVAALALAFVLGALFALGAWLRERALVATTGVALAFAASSFAFLALGAALAAIVLLCMGGALVWQAENLRGYFRRTSDAPS